MVSQFIRGSMSTIEVKLTNSALQIKNALFECGLETPMLPNSYSHEDR